uniref:Uncharacterized protein n=1 Tax=Arundo donax TaxID=35708 RepID=A0A0A8YHP0_ARUDO
MNKKENTIHAKVINQMNQNGAMKNWIKDYTETRHYIHLEREKEKKTSYT